MSEARKLARSGDPMSSHLAAEMIEESGQRARQKTLVLLALQDFVRFYGHGATSAELAAFRHWSRYMPARRLPDLADDGLVQRGPQRICSIKRTVAIEWWPRGNR